jgi:hypothetical protein
MFKMKNEKTEKTAKHGQLQKTTKNDEKRKLVPETRKTLNDNGRTGNDW